MSGADLYNGVLARLIDKNAGKNALGELLRSRLRLDSSLGLRGCSGLSLTALLGYRGPAMKIGYK